MEQKDKMAFNRNISSREGLLRLPSREKDTLNNMRKTGTSFGGSQQNFYRNSQYKERDCFNELDSPSQPQSQIQSSTDDFILNSLNIAIDETGFLSTMKADLLQVQEDINNMDYDGKIRSSNPSELTKLEILCDLNDYLFIMYRKNQTYFMMKFLNKNSNANVKKQFDNKLNQFLHLNICDLVKFMSVKDEGEALKKIYKMMGTKIFFKITKVILRNF